MRKAISRFTPSLAALLTDQTTVIDADGRTENIRTAVLQALSEVDGSPALDTITEMFRGIVHKNQMPVAKLGRFSVCCAGL